MASAYAAPARRVYDDDHHHDHNPTARPGPATMASAYAAPDGRVYDHRPDDDHYHHHRLLGGFRFLVSLTVLPAFALVAGKGDRWRH